MRQNKQDFSFDGHGSIPWMDLWGKADAKNKLLHNMVMLHIKLKGIQL